MIAGYPLLASILSVFFPGAGSEPSVAFRVGVAFLAVVVFFSAGRRWTGRDRLILFLFATFWSIYAGRILHEYAQGSDFRGLGFVRYTAYTLLFAVIPALGAIGARWSFEALERAVSRTILLGILALLISALGLATMDYSVEMRAGLEKLNPILLGHLGALVFLVALGHRRISERSAHIPARVPIMLLALIILVIAGSKGPVIALFLALALWALSAGRNAVKVLVLCLLVAFFLQYGLPRMGIDVLQLELLDRVEAFLGNPQGDVSTRSRLISYHAALNQFLDSPIYGDALFDRATGYYPHNALLEAGMAMGILGLLPLVILLVMALTSSVRAFASLSPSGWLHLIAVEQIIGAMFSGGLFAATWFFFMIAAVQLREFDKQTTGAVHPALPHRTRPTWRDQTSRISATVGPRWRAESGR